MVKTMILEKLLENIDYQLIQGDLKQNVSQIDYDSRQVINESLFVCLPGSKVDGHHYAKNAVLSGAKVIVIEKKVDYQEGVTYLLVKNARYALAILSCAFFHHPSHQMTVIGITGTKGKTTTSYMVESILNHAGKKVGIIGTIGSVINGEYRKTKNTTPESFELQRLMYEMVLSGCEYCVMEVSSQGLMLDRVAGIDFDYGVFTNLSPDHISEHEHHSFEHYMECKKKLFHMCKIGFFNKDDEHYEDMIAGAKCQIQTFSMKTKSNLQAYDSRLSRGKGTLGVIFSTRGLINDQFEVDIPGEFSVYNSLVALMLCHALNIETIHMKEALKKVRVKGRVEIIPTQQDYTVMIDYAHNAVSFENILQTIQAYYPKRLICLYGSVGERTEGRRYEMGEIVSRYGAFSILTADNPGTEPIHAINQGIIEGLNVHQGEYIEIEDRKEAIVYALKHAQDGDVILCLGKGHEDYQLIDGIEVPFSEKMVIQNYFDKKSKIHI
jgi:UDP-N-acetylmuramyl-tripeptide synthetase